MIDTYVNELPSCEVSIHDFPYLQGYYEYVLEESTEGFKIPNYRRPELVIKDTPYSESHFIENDSKNIIVFDVSTSLLLNHLTEILLTGKVTREAWSSLLGSGANFMLAFGHPYAGLMLAVNRTLDLKNELLKKTKQRNSPLLNLKGFLELKGAFDSYSGIPRCQEMFTLAHEITHFFIAKNLYKLKKLPIYIYDNLINEKGADPSTRLLLNRILGHIGKTDEEDKVDIKRLRRIFFSRRFAEETLCDLKAAEITLEYFTWDRYHYGYSEVCASIQAAMRSYLLVASFRNHIKLLSENRTSEDRETTMTFEIFLRTKIMYAFLSKALKSHVALNFHSRDEQIDEIIKYDICLNENIRKRTAVIEQCLFGNLLTTLFKLVSTYQCVNGFIKYPEYAALHYMGYKSPNTTSKDFMSTDGTLFQRNPGLREKLVKEAKIDLYEIDKKTKKNASKIMNSVVF